MLDNPGKSWKLEELPNQISLISDTRMPLPGKPGPMDTARQALRDALQRLKANDFHILEGLYSTKFDGHFDIENILFYNVGSGAFRNSTPNGLRARRCRLHIAQKDGRFAHRIDYKLVPTPKPAPSPHLHLLFRPISFKSPFEIWWAMAAAQILVHNGHLAGRYRLHVELACKKPRTAPAAVLKKLLDGIISAFQADPEPDPEAMRRLSTHHGLAEALLAEHLKRPTMATFPDARPGRLLRPYRDYVQWHPADHLCEDLTLVVRQANEDRCEVYLYPLPFVGMASAGITPASLG